MNKNPFILSLIALALASLACGVTINVPVDRIVTGPLQTDAIHVAEPDAEVADVTVSFGAGELKIEPGAEDELITGTATYNVSDFKPEIEIDGSKIVLQSGNLKLEGIPRINDDIRNEWELKFSEMPIDLTLNAGAYQGDLELGGLALRSLKVNDGAADVDLRFSEPNKTEMSSLRYSTGFSNNRLTGLANANFSTMIFQSGAGDYTLDFSGKLVRDAAVTIETGISQVTIIVPKGTSALVDYRGGVSNVDSSGSWTRSGNKYVLDGSGPLLTITVDIAGGNLILRTS
jgi:hypothetical protein